MAEIINMNLTEYMGPRHDEIQTYVYAVVSGFDAGRDIGPLTTTCPECGSSFSDLDKAWGDEDHILVLTTSDTVAVVVACEGYFVVNPNRVGIDCPNWMGPDDEATIITPEGVHLGTPGAPVIVTSRSEIERWMQP